MCFVVLIRVVGFCSVEFILPYYSWVNPLVACFVVDGRRKTEDEDGRGFFGCREKGEVKKEEERKEVRQKRGFGKEETA